MTVSRDFVTATLALSLAAFALFGGLGLLVLALLAYIRHLVPQRRDLSSDLGRSPLSFLLIQENSLQTLPGPEQSGRYILELVFCMGLAMLGMVRLETPGLLGSLLLG